MFSNADSIDIFASWRSLPAEHQPRWSDETGLNAVVSYLHTLPPLVFAGETDQLLGEATDASRGRVFVLMSGDCAESFAESTTERIRAKTRTILQMAVILMYGSSVPVVKIGRVAGQYSKPRSFATEVHEGRELLSYFGDAVDGHELTVESRKPDPRRLVKAYQRSVATLNLIHAFTQGGFADLPKVHEWNQGFVVNPAYVRYETVAAEIDRAMRFMRAVGVDDQSLRTVDLYSAHEALILPYEDSLTRIDSRTGRPYNCSAHFLWVDGRTRQPDGAHVEMLSKVANPIGVKIGPDTKPTEVLALVDRLNPGGKVGRLTLINRVGARRIADRLPAIVEAVRKDGWPVTWVTGPTHGNTISTSNGTKTQRLEDILAEIKGFFVVHGELGTHPGGIHVELTGDDATEVLGGTEEVVEDILGERHRTLVGPRLSHQQSLEMALIVAKMLHGVSL